MIDGAAGWRKCCANGALIVVIILLLQLVYTEAVMENSPSSRFVLKVSAADPDVGANGQISYSLHGPNADKFHLNYRTGMNGARLGARRSGVGAWRPPPTTEHSQPFSSVSLHVCHGAICLSLSSLVSLGAEPRLTN